MVQRRWLRWSVDEGVDRCVALVTPPGILQDTTAPCLELELRNGSVKTNDQLASLSSLLVTIAETDAAHANMTVRNYYVLNRLPNEVFWGFFCLSHQNNLTSGSVLKASGRGKLEFVNRFYSLAKVIRGSFLRLLVHIFQVLLVLFVLSKTLKNKR